MWRGFVNQNSRTVPIEGGPSWINTDRFLIDAKTNSPQTQEMMKGPMMRTVLEGRFKLTIHRDVREGPVYALSVAKGGLKLTALTGSCIPLEEFDFRSLRPGEKGPAICDSAIVRSGKLDFLSMSIADFCQNLALSVLDRPVMDRTGIPGRFNFHLEFAPDELTPPLTPGNSATAGTPPEPGPSIFTAIKELGFKIESMKGPVPRLVIDHIEKPESN
jgi:uncharacterized protein (TIGR03435 family)